MADPSMSRHDTSPYVELDRSDWSRLADGTSQPLSEKEIDAVRGLGDELDLDEVREVYLALTKLILMRVRLAHELHAATERFLDRPQPQRTPYVIGLAGSVAVGKSTTARLLRELLSHTAPKARVDLVTTDGFLLPNAELRRRELLERKGFPESYDRKALLRFVMNVKSGREVIEAPLYSHLKYDVTDDVVTLDHPDIVIVEGLNVLQPARMRGDGRPGLAISDFFDFSIYVDASHRDIRQWYVNRFLRLRETAFRDPASYFVRYAGLDHNQAIERAETLWDTINGPNLKQNIAPTRGRATLVLRKDSDHSVRWVRLRKL
ncbi:type I pantothenate kinase [Solicola gregarius]|uniref:Pantothenate kinase n=1 Tax=Solicola gregarius TaxID=2908642 RepID=A0AA46TEF5_9ACTN|nr:type I pantothenate kinase [Solicola gregarius]UYM03826.1 type I pantothenate kinase [Solicola gregarius]